MKRGISAVVATVLIILITVAAVTIIWTAIIPMIQEQIEFEEQLVDLSINTFEGYTVWDNDTQSMSVHISRGSDNTKISGIQFIFTRGGISETYISDEIPGKNQMKVYNFDLTALGGKPDSVSIAPVFVKGNAETIGTITDTIEDTKLPEGEVAQEELITIGMPSCGNPLLQASWNSTSDILADGSFDSVIDKTGEGKLPSVIQDGEDYVLKAEGELGVHIYERVVKEYFEPSMGSWGGEIYVNLKNISYSGSNYDLAFVGAYDSAGPPRNFVIASHYEPGAFAPKGGYIYIKAYHNSDSSIGFLIPETAAQMFHISDALEWSWPDRYIKIEWFITPSKKLFGRVDDSDWKELPSGINYINFTQAWFGWVSSINGGSVSIKNITLYPESCIPDWMLAE